ncbi:SigB/SigF/SigG family RNA polymerase sigma factor [Streptantibioticus cattleyicolor]|uniref:RNA polymerase, sigma 28 subunit, Sig B/F/G subfamily n=1 Tax=Streptantibioticus cattleyicolor (strain ATCC 35852 / DSM 46488 / JCM 4925 / NBRC 14057 / NRRL 8057) TaxID=1003195 RepID=F8JM12_STREN|nr:SigB/SigF/SigG family RNA polymerase sigma factor [Streptantibioticus cattleyicolor]AEW99465.1 RNA polymerase, sigma 28 subunit, Sig B/F/G subfamily [Streptantibioticus cattleyicolor NRRL 8057 = DSM 46488]CCB71494.1 RNA polymerase sigma-F factor [Streptantibioticus cattleyicolor NRRL 8057 = DSM 46488]
MPAQPQAQVAATTRSAREPARDAGTAEIREMSRVMFARLATLEEGTEEYQYVRNSLIELNTALVRFAARRFSQRAEQMDDILQVGLIGLIKAVDRYDPGYGTEFVSFALPTITGEMKRFFRDTSWAVRVPRRLQELRIELAKATDVLAVELDRDPTAAELAAHLGIGEDEVREARTALGAYNASSLDARTRDEDADEGSAWSHHLGGDDPALERVENLTALRPLIARLPERERAILALRFGSGLTQREIGRRLGLSQMHISRLLTRTLATLREQLLAEP